MRRTLLSITAALALLPAGLWAALSVGPLSATQTFDTTPPVGDWSTLNVVTAIYDWPTVVEVDASFTTLLASSINTVLGTSATVPPALATIARRNTALNLLQTAPTTSEGLFLMATLTNGSGGVLNTVSVSYDLGRLASGTAGDGVADQVTGHRAFFSVTGAAGSWTAIPEFTTGTAGPKTAGLNVGSWAAGATLYIVWADQNSAGGGDYAYTIDNFFAGLANVPAAFIVEPKSTNAMQGSTVTLTCLVGGSPPFIYQWLKNGMGITGETNSSLVLTNLQPATNSYQVRVTGGFGSPITSSNAVVAVVADTTLPTVLSVVRQANITNIIVTFSEPMANATLFDSYFIATDYELGTELGRYPTNPDGINFSFVPGSGNTKVLLATLRPDDVNQPYIILIFDVADMNGNTIYAVDPIQMEITIPLFREFQQGVNSYNGTVDTEIRGGSPAVLGNTVVDLLSDGADGGGIVQVLLRFNNIFGGGADQIPLGSTIESATLHLTSLADNSQSAGTISMHPMLIDWQDTTATWDLLTGGVQTDGTEASATAYSSFNPNFANPGGNTPVTIDVDVTSSLRAWVTGAPANRGWVMVNSATDGYRFQSADAPTVANHPRLTVQYGGCGAPAAPVIVAVPPTNVITVAQSTSFEIAFGATGCPAPAFQWFFRLQGGGSFNPIADATNASYFKDIAYMTNEGTYYVRISNASGTTNSPQITLDVIPDIVAPGLVSALGSGATNLTRVTVVFTEAMDKPSAELIANYTTAPLMGVTAATLVNPTTVHLTINAVFGRRYNLTVRNVKDLSTSNSIPAGGILTEITTGLLLADWGVPWSYEISNTDLYAPVPPFYALNYIASAWPTGPGAFGNEQVPAGAGITWGTTVVATNFTSYYRNTNIVWPYLLGSLDPSVQIVLRHAVDDGAMFYFNGNEALRFKMDAAPAVIGHTNFSNAGGEAVMTTNFLSPSVLSVGANTVAASLHQASATSSDNVFAVQVLAILPLQAPVLITSVPTTNHIVVTQGQAFSMTFGVSGLEPKFQWFFSNTVSSFQALASATNNAYNVARAFGSNEGFYYLRATNAYPSATNSPIIQVTVVPETIAPALVSALRQTDGTTVIATFSEAVFAGGLNGGSTNPANYTITKSGNPNIAVSSVTRAGNGLTVTITAASAIGEGYLLTVANVTDLAGNELNPFIALIRAPLIFQQGVGGYLGTVDAWLRQAQPDTDLGTTTNRVLVDPDDPAGQNNQGLLRFNGLIGSGVGQIPSNATISSATLRLTTENVTVAAAVVSLHRMLVTWDSPSTWNIMGAGVSLDGIEALASADASFNPIVDETAESIDVTASVQAWASGAANLGWLLVNSDNDGYAFHSSEWATTNQRPQLEVEFTTGCIDLTITAQPPGNITLREPAPLTINFAVSGSLPVYQWQRSSTTITTFTNIPGANNPAYTLAATVPANSGVYRCVVTNNCPSAVTSTVCNVTVNADNVPPNVLSAIARANQSDPMMTVVVTVDEALMPAGANTPGNYTISRLGGASPVVTNAVLANGTNVTLSLNSNLTFGVLYTIQFGANVTDNSTTPNRVVPSSTNILQQSVVLTFSNAWSYEETLVATNDATGTVADGLWTNTPAWYAPTYTPVGWLNGTGILALEPSQATIDIAPAPFVTLLTQPTHTIYFRTTAIYSGPTANVGFVANHFIDDGLMCYVNGSESFRFKMPTNAVITHTNQSSGGGEAINASTNLTTGLVPGNNRFACSVHAQGTGSSDAVFGLEILAQFPLTIPTAGPKLTIRREGTNQVAVSWSPALGTLQETTVMTNAPVWIISPNQANPQTNIVTTRKFYSLRP